VTKNVTVLQHSSSGKWKWFALVKRNGARYVLVGKSKTQKAAIKAAEKARKK